MKFDGLGLFCASIIALFFGLFVAAYVVAAIAPIAIAAGVGFVGFALVTRSIRVGR